MRAKFGSISTRHNYTQVSTSVPSLTEMVVHPMWRRKVAAFTAEIAPPATPASRRRRGPDRRNSAGAVKKGLCVHGEKSVSQTNVHTHDTGTRPDGTGPPRRAGRGRAARDSPRHARTASHTDATGRGAAIRERLYDGTTRTRLILHHSGQARRYRHRCPLSPMIAPARMGRDLCD